jgi:hypothetical protein
MAFKTFANGFPLPASDLNNFLMKQSVIVFASAAARTSAIPEPVEGMLTYLEDDNELYKWTGADWENILDPSVITTQGDLILGDASGLETRLPIGAADTVLKSNGTTAIWEASGGAVTTDWVKLQNEVSFPTGATTGSVTFTSGYDKYAIWFEGITSNLAGDLSLSILDTSSAAIGIDRYIFSNATAASTTNFYTRSSSSNSFYVATTAGGRPFVGAVFLSGCTGGLIHGNVHIGVDRNQSGFINTFGHVFFDGALADVAGIQLDLSSGVFGGSGILSVYGA